MLSPYIPMLFIDEEYADDTPFFYFVSHSDPQFIEAGRKGRNEEFKDFSFDAELPDAQDEKTFQRSKIHWEKRKTKKYHNLILQWNKQLNELRRTNAVLRNFD